jgi:hydrogenase nickel incorporation protein HypB
MCATCGCSPDQGAGHERPHEHGHPHPDHSHEHVRPAVVTLEEQVLARNDRQAQKNRHLLSERRIFAVNVMGSPGAGKTSLLERTVRTVGGDLHIEVIEGDQETDHDARRLRETGCAVVQLNTGTGCHLDASMVERGLHELVPAPGSVLVIENVGNLVCPSLFDLGEHARVVVASVTEGDDKPVKYPHMFRAATVIVLNKMDLLPYVPFDMGRFLEHSRQVNPRAVVIPVSATRGDNFDEWVGWLRGKARHASG